MAEETKEVTKTELPKCGIVMPISAIDNCPMEHWADVLTILKNIITTAGFEPNLVSAADEIGIIQKRIIQNLYNNEMVVCDVSGKNPNVMFELGMRLAFDKPTIIIKDDKTSYSFDTSVIEHLEYPRDLRYTTINIFKEELKKRIEATYNRSQNDGSYSTFLKNFGQYKIAHLEEKEVSSNEFILESLSDIRKQIASLNSVNAIQSPYINKEDIEAAKDNLFKIVDTYASVTNKKITDFTKEDIDFVIVNYYQTLHRNNKRLPSGLVKATIDKIINDMKEAE